MIEKLSERCFKFSLPSLGKWNLFSYVIITNNYVFVIDTGCGSMDALNIIEFINNKKLNKKIIVINTHYHWDHIWGNFCFENCLIISHEKCYEIIKDKWDYMLERNKEFIRGEVKLALPNMTFTNSLIFKEDDIELFYAPGHTEDGICIYDKVDKFLYVGDNIGDDEIEFIPELSIPKEDYIKSLHKMKDYDIKLLLSGHNTPQEKFFIDKIIEGLKEKD